MAENKFTKDDESELRRLLHEVKGGDDGSFSLLKKKYAPLIMRSVRSYQGEASQIDEYHREAESALLKAALRYNGSMEEVSFGLFAKICIRNALISLYRKETSRKRRLERHDGRGTGDKKRFYIQPTEGEGSSATHKIIDKIEAVLSAYERAVFREYMSGKTADEMAEALGKSKKSVNNALCRIKEKVKKMGLSDDQSDS